MDIEIIASKIAKDYVNSSSDMNASIAKYASENDLSLEYTKRLVEEANKQCYLMKLASTGEQTFDVAQYDKIRELVKQASTKMKTASANIQPMDYSMNKTASEDYSIIDIREAVQVCHERIGNALNKMAEMRVKLTYANPEFMGQTIEKIASHDDGSELRPYLDQIEKQKKIITHLEKQAGLISGLAGATLKGGAAIGGKAIKTTVSNPMKTMYGVGVASAVKEKALEAGKTSTSNVVSNIPNVHKLETSITKNAGLKDELMTAGKYLAAAGVLGIGVTAAKGLGGITARMMQERQLNNAFENISGNNADIRGIPNARDYFDVIARHSPSLALDPMVAPQIIRQFDSFGGVDVNTIAKLREMEGRPADKPATMDLVSQLSGVAASFRPKKQ